MRRLISTLVLVGLALAFLGCARAESGAGAGPPDHGKGDGERAPEPPAVGTETDLVTIHLIPADANAPFTIKITPELPAFRVEPSAPSLVFVRRPPGPDSRWQRVSVGDFHWIGAGQAGQPSASCQDVGGDASEEGRCQVTFEAQPDGSLRAAKYTITLESENAADTLVLDPVIIIMGG